MAPDQLVLLALLHNGIEEAPEDIDSIAFTNTGQTRMVGQRLTQIKAQVPQNAESISGMPHELPSGSNSLKEHHELQFEEDHRINGGTTLVRIGLMHELAHKREIKCALQMTVEVVCRYQVFH